MTTWGGPSPGATSRCLTQWVLEPTFPWSIHLKPFMDKDHTELVSESLSVMSDSLRPHELYSPWNSLG